MACVVTDKCFDCSFRDCIAVCPIDCMFAETDDGMVYVHPEECFECLCCYQACPREAIYPERSLPEDKRAWTEINARKVLSGQAKRLIAIPQPRATPEPAQLRCASAAYRGSATGAVPPPGLPITRRGEAPQRTVWFDGPEPDEGAAPRAPEAAAVPHLRFVSLGTQPG